MIRLARVAVAAVLAATGCSPSSSTPAPPVDASTEDAADDVAADAPILDATSEEAGPSCALPFLGDPSLPTVLELSARNVDGTSTPLVEGATVPLVTPPQGGKIAFIGVRATNVNPCSVQILGSLRDPINQQIRVDGRSINLLATGDGWGGSADANIATFSNIPVCPNQWAAQDTYGQTFELTMTLTDPEGRKASATLHVTPQCAEDGDLLAQCLCTCKLGYTLGQVCP